MCACFCAEVHSVTAELERERERERERTLGDIYIPFRKKERNIKRGIKIA